MKLYYMNGAGNDFMVMDARNKNLKFDDLERLTLKYCKLTGADGFMAVDCSELADFKLHFYNSDGTRGEMCGNGARCICRFAYELGVVGEKMVVETDAGLVYGTRLSETEYRVLLNNPGVLDLDRTSYAAYVELGNPGVPHAVQEVPGLTWEQKEELYEMAKALRHDRAFPKGANANLYTWIAEDKIRILTFERGVEDYTLACGTGSASTAVVIHKKGLFPNGKLIVENPGGTLRVTIEETDGEIQKLYLEGPTEITKIYEIEE